MKYYLAYGSNLNKDQMAFRCPDAVPIGTGTIKHYRLVFRRGVLTIEPSPGEYVPVGVWQISEEDEKSLDRYEGVPRFYRKETVPIVLNKTGELVDALYYVMNPGFPIDVPSQNYMWICTKGYEDFGMDPDPLLIARDQAVRKAMERDGKGGDA